MIEIKLWPGGNRLDFGAIDNGSNLDNADPLFIISKNRIFSLFQIICKKTLILLS